MKVYKLEVLIIDQDVNSIEDAMDVINCTEFANHTSVEAFDCYQADIGEWYDEHPLNNKNTRIAEMNRLFPVEKFPTRKN